MKQTSQMMNDAAVYIEFIEKIHARWHPHRGQVRVGKALFDKDIRDIFLECGRNWGKTEFAAYALLRWAWCHSESENYYFAPEQKQGREIIWESNRLQNMVPKEWISGSPNQTEMRITLTNGSFIKVDGSDNIDSYRGVKPKGLIVLEEYKDFRPGFYDVFDPNRAPYNAPILIIGTPPDVPEHHFITKADEFLNDPDKAYFNAPTSENPIINEQWLAKKKSEYYNRGEGEAFEREYMARRVFGGKKSILPMVNSFQVTPHDEVMRSIVRDAKKLQFFCVADPGTTTCFATLFGCINPYSKIIYLLDEIYETDQAKTSVSIIGSRMVEKQVELGFGRAEWDEVADEAAAWFINEMSDRFEHHFRPTEKAQNKKEFGLSLIKDIFLKNKIVISDRCIKLMWEMMNYVKDDRGNIPKLNDHLIDCFRYFLAAAGYQLETEAEPLPEDKNENFRGARIEDDFPELRDVSGDEFY
jgi:hypothetical protein